MFFDLTPHSLSQLNLTCPGPLLILTWLDENSWRRSNYFWIVCCRRSTWRSLNLQYSQALIFIWDLFCLVGVSTPFLTIHTSALRPVQIRSSSLARVTCPTPTTTLLWYRHGRTLNIFAEGFESDDIPSWTAMVPWPRIHRSCAKRMCLLMAGDMWHFSCSIPKHDDKFQYHMLFQAH